MKFLFWPCTPHEFLSLERESTAMQNSPHGNGTLVQGQEEISACGLEDSECSFTISAYQHLNSTVGFLWWYEPKIIQNTMANCWTYNCSGISQMANKCQGWLWWPAKDLQLTQGRSPHQPDSDTFCNILILHYDVYCFFTLPLKYLKYLKSLEFPVFPSASIIQFLPTLFRFWLFNSFNSSL